ncbi:DUF2344 domain-containing protein [Yimella sp. cx-573]|nr:DUF2344 domain-containing protein [Yimella sp. cx-573]
MAKRVPEGPPPAPVVQRLRLQYAKRGRLRFTSSRDFQRALERAIRRAQIPIAFSAGFHPHPRISYANAAATGTASEAEFFELALQRECDPEQVRVALDEALPEGLDIVRVVVAGAGSLADGLQASSWKLEFEGVASGELARAVLRLMQQERVEVTRMMKSGPRTFDVRSAIRHADVQDAQLLMTLEHTTPAVRPDDVLTALRQAAAFEPQRSPLVTRLEQGVLDQDAQLLDPLAARD